VHACDQHADGCGRLALTVVDETGRTA